MVSVAHADEYMVMPDYSDMRHYKPVDRTVDIRTNYCNRHWIKCEFLSDVYSFHVCIGFYITSYSICCLFLPMNTRCDG